MLLGVEFYDAQVATDDDLLTPPRAEVDEAVEPSALEPSRSGTPATVASSPVGANDLMRLPARKLLLQLIQREPGVDVRDVPQRIGVARGTALYHMHMLARSSLVRIVRDGRKQFLFPSGAGAPRPPEHSP